MVHLIIGKKLNAAKRKGIYFPLRANDIFLQGSTLEEIFCLGKL